MRFGKVFRITVLSLVGWMAFSGAAFALCDQPLGGFAIYQCADLAYVAPTTAAGVPVPIVFDASGVPTNVTAVFWQIGFGNDTINDGTGSSGTGNVLKKFNGNDSGISAVTLLDARLATADPNIPPDAICLQGRNWGNTGIDGCCDNVRTIALSTADDDILNPYYDVYSAGAGYAGYYSLDWQQDYPMGILFKLDDPNHPAPAEFFAVAAVATMDRGNTGDPNNQDCSDPNSVTNPATCDTRGGFYPFKDVANGLTNAATGLPNAIPWQEVPEPHVDAAMPVNPNDVNSDVDLEISWPAVTIYSDLSVRPSGNPAMAPADANYAGGVGVADIGAKFPLVRYVVEVAPLSDPAFDPNNLQQRFECSIAYPLDSDPNRCTSASSAAFRIPVQHCFRIRTVLGKKSQTAGLCDLPTSTCVGGNVGAGCTQDTDCDLVTELATCRVGRCGDIGYEVVSGRTCSRGDVDADGVLDLNDNCPDTYNPGQEDGDGDLAGDDCDICVATYNPASTPQVDTNADGDINAADCPNEDPETFQCDFDADGSGDICDNCLLSYNPGQEDGDADLLGDACDNCPLSYNPASTPQVDTNLDGDIDADDCPNEGPVTSQCDYDLDGFGDVCDYCSIRYNPGQEDGDADEVGDDCDICVTVYNPAYAPLDPNLPCVPWPETLQCDADQNGRGDHCEVCYAGDPDGDTFCDDPVDPNDPFTFNNDNCPQVDPNINSYNPDQTDTDLDREGDLCDDDDDNDLIPDDGDGSGVIGDYPCLPDPNGFFTQCDDNCRLVINEDQDDSDADGLGDLCDNCSLVYNPVQPDVDSDLIGDECDLCSATYNPALTPSIDTNNDGFLNLSDCRQNPVTRQCDYDNDRVGDACDNCWNRYNPSGFLEADTDGDGDIDGDDQCIPDTETGQCDFDADGFGGGCDNCPVIYNPGQENADGDSFGDACDACDPNGPSPDDDADHDRVCDDVDTCLNFYNPSNLDTDSDGRGDDCDNCARVPNPGQEATDTDLLGDACDNCPTVYNAANQAILTVTDPNTGQDMLFCRQDPDSDQCDLDLDGEGDACDLTIYRPVDLEVFSPYSDTLDCTSDDGRPQIRWRRGWWDRYRVQVSWDPAFPKRERITSGRKMLGRNFWRMGKPKWRRLCRNADQYLYIRVIGIDKNLPKGHPNRRVVSSVVQVEVIK